MRIILFLFTVLIAVFFLLPYLISVVITKSYFGEQLDYFLVDYAHEFIRSTSFDFGVITPLIEFCLSMIFPFLFLFGVMLVAAPIYLLFSRIKIIGIYFNKLIDFLERIEKQCDDYSFIIKEYFNYLKEVLNINKKSVKKEAIFNEKIKDLYQENLLQKLKILNKLKR